jgi:hypothetical protein
MIKIFAVLFYILLSSAADAQDHCISRFQTDTLTLPGEPEQLNGQSLEVTLKDLSSVKLFSSDNGRLFLRIITTRNFYFNMTDVLEIQSGSKSYYAKNTKQYKLDKSRGQFTTEIYKNYVATLKEHGITGIVFGGAETGFTKQDAGQVKEIAGCLYESISVKR